LQVLRYHEETLYPIKQGRRSSLKGYISHTSNFIKLPAHIWPTASLPFQSHLPLTHLPCLRMSPARPSTRRRSSARASEMSLITHRKPKSSTQLKMRPSRGRYVIYTCSALWRYVLRLLECLIQSHQCSWRWPQQLSPRQANVLPTARVEPHGAPY